MSFHYVFRGEVASKKNSKVLARVNYTHPKGCELATASLSMEPLTLFEKILDPPARLGMEFVPPFDGPSVRCNPVSPPFL